MIGSWVLLLAISCVFMSILFAIANLKKDMSIADIGWGGDGVLLILAASMCAVFSVKKAILVCLIVLWATRLTWHVVSRHRGEDARYQALRKKWGDNVLIQSFFNVFLLQAVLSWVIASSAVLILMSSHLAFSLLDGFAVGLWLLGFLFESIADYQLACFIKNPANQGKIMKEGLWRYSRHPNYFGELCMWWAIYLMTLSIPYGWVTIVGPITLTILLLFVSGVPLVEKQFSNNDAYERYKKETSSIIPWFCKKID